MSATTRPHEKTSIELDSRVPKVTIVRDFDAPVAHVFRAYVEPELFRRWIGPRDRSVEIHTFECRTGGSWRYTIGGDGGFEAGFFGAFHEVRGDERIVQTFTFEGVPDQVALETATFESLGDGRTRVTSVSLVDSFEDRDAFVASGMESGVVEGYEKLDEVLSGLA